MVRTKKRKALYEVMSKTKKSSSAEIFHAAEDADQVGSADRYFDGLSPAKDRHVRWSKEPRLVFFNNSRVEISISYSLAIAIALAFVLVLTVAYRLGLNAAAYTKNDIVQTEQLAQPVRSIAPDIKEETEFPENENNPVGFRAKRIVIQQLSNRKNLVPVQDFFAGFGIKTQIRLIKGTYYLVTEQKYGNPDKIGTFGYRAKQKIVRIGAGYKPPDGFAGFGKNPFATAYGMKFDN